MQRAGGNFSNYVYVLFTKAPDEISAHILQPISASSSMDTGGVNPALQQAFYEGMSIVNAVWERGGKLDILPYLWAVILFIMVDVQINAPGTDTLGAAGIAADQVDHHLFEQFGTATLLSIIGAGASTK